MLLIPKTFSSYRYLVSKAIMVLKEFRFDLLPRRGGFVPLQNKQYREGQNMFHNQN